jgi:nucleotide-binding universal stress UspA family protein
MGENMSYNSIVVFLDNTPRNTARMDFAIDLALRHRAHLTGLHVTHSPLYAFAPEAGLGLLIAKVAEYEEQERKAVEVRFREAARRASVSYDWDFLQGEDVPRAAIRARAYDLVIVGQNDPDNAEARIAEGFPDLVVMGAGRPVLFAPYGGPLRSDFRHALVAWNGSREAARALADALPLLVQAANVSGMAVEPRSDERGPELLPELDVAAYLSRNGVKAELQRIPAIDISVGEWLLSSAAEIGADLTVAGAYGHARMREWVLGGVTRTLLRSMTVPVLMSH